LTTPDNGSDGTAFLVLGLDLVSVFLFFFPLLLSSSLSSPVVMILLLTTEMGDGGVDNKNTKECD